MSIALKLSSDFLSNSLSLSLSLLISFLQLTLGVLSNEIGDALKPYLHHRTHFRPWCVAKIALSIDGKVNSNICSQI
jgi:hypothetical protein